MDLIGLTGPARTSPRSSRPGRTRVAINAEDAGLAVHRGEPEPAVRRPAAHLVEGERPRDLDEPEPGRLGPVHADHPLHVAGLRPGKNPNYWQAGAPKIPCLEYVQASVERRRAAADPERPGRLDAQLRPERREGVRSRRTRRTTTPSTRRPRTRSRSIFDTTQYPYSLVAVPQGAQPWRSTATTVSKLGEYGYAPPTDAIGLTASSRSGSTRRERQGAGEAARDLQPDGGEEAADRQRLHLQGQQADRPEGQPGQLRHPRDLGLVGLGRVAPDHHQEPAGDRHRLERQARAGLELLVPERVERRRTRRCSGRTPRRARRTASSTRTSRRTRTSRPGQDAHGDRQLGALPEPDGDRRSSTSGR